MTEPKLATVLIIDDEPAILSSLERLLRREFDLVLARSGAEGLELLGSHQPQVIISDQRMPDMSGGEFFSQVANKYPDAVRLLLTGYADLDSVISAINKGEVYRYLVKPWNADELRSTVREAAERYQLTMQNRRLMQQLVEANAVLEERVDERTAELAAANEKLRQLDRLKDELLALTSHDLRSLVATIRMSSQMLLDPKRAARIDANHYLRNIAQATDRLMILLNDLSDLTMINTGTLRLHLQPVLLSDVVQMAVRELAVRVDAKSLVMNVAVAEQEPFVRGDYDRLYQVVGNLLGNAIKFTPLGGRITIAVRPDADNVLLSVSDTGIGIPDTLLPELFDRFTNNSRPGTAGERGSGLGLAIVRRLAEMQGGAIMVESVEGQGSTFTIRLPAMPGPA